MEKVQKNKSFSDNIIDKKNMKIENLTEHYGTIMNIN